MQVAIASGKGGTGKTTVVASFAVLAGKAVLVDCDVDAADLHLVLPPTILERHEFSGGSRARIMPGLRRAAQQIAASKGLGLVISDGSPGIGCPVIASLTGASLALIVVEPTVSGLHDFPDG